MNFSGAIPTVKAAPELFAAFGEVFHQTMPTITGLAPHEAEEIRVAIMDGEGGHLNMGRYHQTVFERFFSARPWSWPEFEEWRAVFAKGDNWPQNWKRVVRAPEANALNIAGMCELLDVVSIKAALTVLGVPAKGGKSDLAKLAAASSSPDAFAKAAPGWPQAREAYETRRRAEVYALLMLTMSHRAKSLCDRRQREVLGLPPAKRLAYIWPEAKQHAKKVMAQNPDAPPPFFPGDLTAEVE